MKKIIIIMVICLLFFVASVYAETVPVVGGTVTVHDRSQDTHTTEKNADQWKSGVKADMPNLVKLPWDLRLGIEFGKDTWDTESRDGYFGFIKVTWVGTLFDFSKKKK